MPEPIPVVPLRQREQHSAMIVLDRGGTAGPS
jgi:hypothetical protein